MKFVILTDTHFVAGGRKIYGLDPAERLAAAIEVINRDHRDLAFVIVTGDLAHWGEDAAYENLAGVLSSLHAPTLLLMGNHDRRAAFARYFPGVKRDANGFVQTVQVFDEATIVTLDTLNEAAPNHEGL
ncbi:MAG: phosphodiesterase, partial [Bradyrhizobium icense]